MSKQTLREVEAAMFRRHPEAAADDASACKQIEDGFLCSKPKGHNGAHAAHGTSQTTCHTWT